MKAMPAKQRTLRRGKRAGSDAMLTAIFGALADFAETPDKKLSAIIRAGKIAEAFCSPVTDPQGPSTEAYGQAPYRFTGSARSQKRRYLAM